MPPTKYSAENIVNSTNLNADAKTVHQAIAFEALKQYIKFSNLFVKDDPSLQWRLKDFFQEYSTAEITTVLNHDEGTTIVMAAGVGDEDGNAVLFITYNDFGHPTDAELPPLRLIDSIVQHFDTMATLVYNDGKLDPEGRAS